MNKKTISIIIFFLGIFSTVSLYALDKPYVEIAKTKLIQWGNSIFAIGTVKSAKGIYVSSPISGIVKGIHFKSGQTVKKDDILLTLKNQDLQATLDQDKVKYNLSRQQFNRYHKLFKSHAVSEAEIDQLQSQTKEDYAKLEHDNALFEKTIIKAPFSGQLGIRDINQGQYITAGQKIVLLQDSSKMFVDFYIPENKIDQVKIGQNVQLNLKENKHYQWTGKIIALDPAMDEDTRNLRVRAEVNPPYQPLIPGMYVDVFIYPIKTKKLIIPQTAIIYTPNGEFVYLYQKGKVFLKKIQSSYQFGNNVIISHGLNEGDEIVVSGQQKLFNGAAVNLAGNS